MKDSNIPEDGSSITRHQTKEDNVSAQDRGKAPTIVHINVENEDTRERPQWQTIEYGITKEHAGRFDWEGRQSFQLGRIDFPRFSGSEVDNWIYHCEHYFEIDETPEDSKLYFKSR